MLDSHIRPYIDPPLQRVAKILVRANITANAVTMTGFAIGIIACLCLTQQYYTAALILILLSRIIDGLDGAVARAGQGATDRGAYLDTLTDFIFYSGVVFCFAVGRPETALAAAFLIFSFMGTATSFLSYAILAAQRGLMHEKQGKKSFYYAAGLCEGTETILFFVAFCLLPAYFTQIAVLFGILCWLTTAGRTAIAVKTFKP